jgi:CBS domain-containing protein
MTATMKAPLDRIEQLVVADAMTRSVFVLPKRLSMDEAAELLSGAAATGAPVVDEAGHCVGVLSATDFVRFEASRGGSGDISYVWQDRLHGEDLAWNSVQRFMSTGVHTVTAETSLIRAVQIMCAEHVHRLIVLSDDGVPAGILSTLDVVAALMASTDEERQQRQAVTPQPGPAIVAERRDARAGDSFTLTLPAK